MVAYLMERVALVAMKQAPAHGDPFRHAFPGDWLIATAALAAT